MSAGDGVSHPPWCAAGWCTVDGAAGEHRSRPYTVPSGRPVVSEVGEVPEVVVALLQRPGWAVRRTTFVLRFCEVEDDGTVWLSRKEARALVRALAELLKVSR